MLDISTCRLTVLLSQMRCALLPGNVGELACNACAAAVKTHSGCQQLMPSCVRRLCLPVALLQVQTQLANHVAAVGPAIVIGTLCGLLGMAFTVLNLKVMRLRDATLQVRRPRPWPALARTHNAPGSCHVLRGVHTCQANAQPLM